MTDSTSLIRIIQQVQPDEIYNLAAQSHVAVSFEEPEYTANSDALGRLRLLEAIRILGLEKKTRFYQASTSELYGLVQETPQKETTPFYPRCPYAVAKLYAYWITVNYREAYGMYACNGILFNHESPLRGETFVTRKITRALARIKLGLQECLYLGNLDAQRDWGHARDYVEMQWLMLQQDKPEDFVIATGEQYSVRDFVQCAQPELGHGDLLARRGRGRKRRTTVARQSASLPSTRATSAPPKSRPCWAMPARRKRKLGWTPRISFDELVREMVRERPESRRARRAGARSTATHALRLATNDQPVSAHGPERRIYVAGHRGLVGLCHRCASSWDRGYNNLVTRTHEELDLSDQAAVRVLRATKSRTTCSWPRPRSAASSPTTPIRPTSSATIW